MKLISNDSLYIMVDTNKLYKIQTVFNLTDNKYLDNFRDRYLKFYSKNKVAMFYYFDKNDVNTLNPVNADMGYCKFYNGILTTQIYFENPQGNGYIKNKCIILKKDKTQIELKGNDYIDTYQIIDLPNKFLIYKPDW